jgi:hypothetical protein
MYILINADLKLSVGQIAAQTAHIVHIIVEENVRTAYESYPVPESYVEYIKWCLNPITIVKKAPQEELQKLLDLPGAKYFYDDIFSKQTKQKSSQLTIIGFNPSSVLTDTMNDYELL